jgi:S1-C subfamily serine protease
MKRILLALTICLSFIGCAKTDSNAPVIIYTDKPINIMPPPIPHVPEMNGTVDIKTEMQNKLFKAIVRGSGVVVGKINDSYYVATATHVVRNAEKIEIEGNPAELLLNVTGADASILRFKSSEDFFVHKVVNAKFGEEAWGVGFVTEDAYPSVLRNPPQKFFTIGRVCMKDKTALWFNGGGTQGMSGGPLLNKQNEVIGVAYRFLALTSRSSTIVVYTPSEVFDIAISIAMMEERVKEIIRNSSYPIAK